MGQGVREFHFASYVLFEYIITTAYNQTKQHISLQLLISKMSRMYQLFFQIV